MTPIELMQAGKLHHWNDPEIIELGKRAAGYDVSKPVTIGDDVWLGGNVVVNPGVTIGQGTVIGAGSVVTKDIPAGVIAAGNPCKVIREINDEDRVYWENERDEYLKTSIEEL